LIAALFVKVRVKIDRGSIPIDIKYASLVVIVFVLPEPAPARINSGPSICWAAIFVIRLMMIINFQTFFLQ
jgi:hypothetical protein